MPSRDALTTEQSYEACRRLMQMVAELHKMGYERIRLNPGLSPSGAYWRCNVYPVDEKGNLIVSLELPPARTYYSSSEGTLFFGWTDTENDTPTELARKYIERFPIHARYGREPDLAYLVWYRQMLKDTAPLGLVIGYADWRMQSNRLQTINVPQHVVIRRPPTGWNA